MARRSFTVSSLSALAGLGLLLGACASSQTKEADSGAAKSGSQTVAFNKVCPYSAQAVSADAPTREYQGKTIGFCCAGCPGRWDKAADADRDAMLSQIAGK